MISTGERRNYHYLKDSAYFFMFDLERIKDEKDLFKSLTNLIKNHFYVNILRHQALTHFSGTEELKEMKHANHILKYIITKLICAIVKKVNITFVDYHADFAVESYLQCYVFLNALEIDPSLPTVSYGEFKRSHHKFVGEIQKRIVEVVELVKSHTNFIYNIKKQAQQLQEKCKNKKVEIGDLLIEYERVQNLKEIKPIKSELDESFKTLVNSNETLLNYNKSVFQYICEQSSICTLLEKADCDKRKERNSLSHEIHDQYFKELQQCLKRLEQDRVILSFINCYDDLLRKYKPQADLLYQNVKNIKKRANLYHNVKDDIDSLTIHATMELQEQQRLKEQLRFQIARETKEEINSFEENKKKMQEEKIAQYKKDVARIFKIKLFTKENRQMIYYAKSLFAVAQLAQFSNCSFDKDVVNFIKNLSLVAYKLETFYVTK